MREPATSCATCSKVLLPSEIFYTEGAQIVCELCFAAATPHRLRAGARVRTPRSSPPSRTACERRRVVHRWSLLFVGLTITSVYVAQLARAELRSACPFAVIESPRSGELSPHRVEVLGRVVPETVARPLWLIGWPLAGRTGAGPLLRRPVIVDLLGRFSSSLELPGPSGQGYRLSIVSVAEEGNEALESPDAFESSSDQPADWHLQTGRGRQGAVCDHRFREAARATLPPSAVILASVTVVLKYDDDRVSGR